MIKLFFILLCIEAVLMLQPIKAQEDTNYSTIIAVRALEHSKTELVETEKLIDIICDSEAESDYCIMLKAKAGGLRKDIETWYRLLKERGYKFK